MRKDLDRNSKTEKTPYSTEKITLFLQDKYGDENTSALNKSRNRFKGSNDGKEFKSNSLKQEKGKLQIHWVGWRVVGWTKYLVFLFIFHVCSDAFSCFQSKRIYQSESVFKSTLCLIFFASVKKSFQDKKFRKCFLRLLFCGFYPCEGTNVRRWITFSLQLSCTNIYNEYIILYMYNV